MAKLKFNQNDSPTLGVEIELALVDRNTFALSSSIQQVLDRLPDDDNLKLRVKPELMQSCAKTGTTTSGGLPFSMEATRYCSARCGSPLAANAMPSP